MPSAAAKARPVPYWPRPIRRARTNTTRPPTRVGARVIAARVSASGTIMVGIRTLSAALNVLNDPVREVGCSTPRLVAVAGELAGDVVGHVQLAARALLGGLLALGEGRFRPPCSPAPPPRPTASVRAAARPTAAPRRGWPCSCRCTSGPCRASPRTWRPCRRCWRRPPGRCRPSAPPPHRER